MTETPVPVETATVEGGRFPVPPAAGVVEVCVGGAEVTNGTVLPGRLGRGLGTTVPSPDVEL